MADEELEQKKLELDTEYQLTEKGKELAAKLADTNIKKDKLQQDVQKGVIETIPALESTKLKEKLKDVDRKIAESKKLEKDKQKEVKVVSEKTENKVSGLKAKFDPNNMGNLAKFMINDSAIDPKLLEKITGKNKEEKETSVGSKATKVSKLDSVDNDVVDILKKILTLMQKSYDEDKLQSEESKNFEEENAAEKSRKDKEFLAALKEAKDKKDNPTAKEEKEKEKSFVDQLLDVFGLGSGTKTALNVLGKVASFFLTSPIGLALLAGGSLMALLAMDKHAEETNKGIQAAGDIGEANKQMMEVVDDKVMGRKNRLLSERPSEKKSMLFWKDGELQKSYLKEIGFDEKTGLTKQDRDAGFNALDDNGNPIRKQTTASATAESPAGTAAATSGADGSNGTAGAPGASASPVSSTTTTTPAGANGSDGKTGTTGTAGASAAASASTAISAPAAAAATSVTTPTASPVPAASPTASPPATPTPAATTTASPDIKPNLGQKLNETTKENVFSKLQEKIEQVAGAVVNNSATNNISQQQKPPTGKLPSVRNQEETFMRMIYNNTRVV